MFCSIFKFTLSFFWHILVAPGVGGSNHTEAFEKLMEMELRANAKQMHPLDGTGHYGEVDMHLRYR